MRNKPNENLNVKAMMQYVNNSQQKLPTRNYMGMSEIGGVCDAKTWFNFRIATLGTFEASTLFKFDDGHYSEAVTAKRLKSVPQFHLITETAE